MHSPRAINEEERYVVRQALWEYQSALRAEHKQLTRRNNVRAPLAKRLLSRTADVAGNLVGAF